MWPEIDPWFTLVLSGVFGWIWGSFLNAALDRSPPHNVIQEAARKPPEEVATGPAPAAPWMTPFPNMLRPSRSFCFSCGRVIPWYDNLPIVSYLLLRGGCRGCGSAIGARTLVMETLTPLCFLALHEAARSLGWTPGQTIWTALLLSWLALSGMLLVEQRRFGLTHAVLGLLLAAWRIGILLGGG